MKRIHNTIILFFIMCLTFSCSEKSWMDPTSNGKGGALALSNATVISNFAGGSEIKFVLPPESNALYVEAEYDIGNGTIFKRKSSIYTDTLKIDGFIKEGTFDVALRAVSRAEERSEPMIVKVSPKPPPFIHAFESAQVTPDFGGVLVRLDNPTEADLATVLLVKDENGEWKSLTSNYSASENIVFNVRGMEAKETEIALTVRDKFQNFSDTLYWKGTPILEEEIDKSKFKEKRLANDQPDAWGWLMPNLWNNRATEPGFHTPEHPPGGMPQWFTIDLGQIVSLSRFVIYQRMGEYVYSHGNPRTFELYGTAEEPTPSGEWDEKWIHMGAYEVIKPSGQLPGLNSQADIDAAAKGHEFDFPAGVPQIRFLRFKINSVWAAGFFHLMEITLYGQNAK